MHIGVSKNAEELEKEALKLISIKLYELISKLIQHPS
jgi:hypothetical protein